jgi:hypothetical protein
MSVAVDRLIELAKGAMMAAATIHVDLEMRRYEQWRAAPKKGKHKWNPSIDRAALCDTMTDLFEQSVELVKQEASKE